MTEQNQSERDLKHYLKLALVQLQAKLAQRKTANGAFNDELRRLHLLEELLKEQVPKK